MIKRLNYISNINKNQKEMNIIFQQKIKNLNIYYNDNNIKYEEYYFNGIPIPKDIQFNDISFDSFKIWWKIEDIINIDNKNIKYQVEMKKENEEFIKVCEVNDNNCMINNLEENINYEVRICSTFNNVKSNYSQIYKIKTEFIDSVILNKLEKRKEYINKIIEWTGYKSMKYYIEEQEMV